MKGNTMEDTRTISVDSFLSKKNITKAEFVKRWSSPALTIWTLFQDHGETIEQTSFGHTIYKKTEDMAGGGFEKIYRGEKKLKLWQGRLLKNFTGRKKDRSKRP